ncbi:hypothetical protein BDR04DRAFT_1208470 [Suillus decipiens]|nr:hypothetical protein BDR04DRAFT_1208470 [Suillus decipiens]
MDISVKLLNSLDHLVHALQIIAIRMLMTQRIVMGIPDPITGPEGVRMMLFIRGVTGWVLISLHDLKFVNYLSVADATVLIFLTPLTTAVAGSVFLKESYSVKQAGAGGEDCKHLVFSLWMWILLLLMVGVFYFVAQVLFVVVLEFLFFGVIPSLLSILGAAIIMSSALYVVVSGHWSFIVAKLLCSCGFRPPDEKKQKPHHDSTVYNLAT